MMVKALVLLATLLRLVSQPEIIRHTQAERNDGPTDHQEPTIALLFAMLFGFLGGALCMFGGGLW